MRANTQALIADPRFSVQDFGPKGRWAQLAFSSPREALECAKQHARTPNEIDWLDDPHWCGLGAQSAENLDQTGIAEHPLALLRSAVASLPRKHTKPGAIQPAIAGGVYSVPAVLAGLPLAARARLRTKLAPLTINLVCSWSASVTDETLAPVFAKLGRAINDYTLAGGVVSLTVYDIAELRQTPLPGLAGAIIKVRVPTNDLAQIALGCSNAASRAVYAPLQSALSLAPRDSLRVPPPSANPIPSSLYLGGRTTTGDISANLRSVFDALSLR